MQCAVLCCDVMLRHVALRCLVEMILRCIARFPADCTVDAWLRTNGVNTNGAAAKVMNFDRLGKRYALALLVR